MMKTRNPEERRADTLLLPTLVSLAWIPIGVFAAVQGHLFEVTRIGGDAQSLQNWLLFQLPRWAPWVLLTPITYWLVRRSPRWSDRPWRGLAIHAVAGTLVVLTHSAISALLYQLAYPATLGRMSYLEVLNRQASVWLVIAFVIYGGLVGIWTVVEYRRRLQEGALRAARLESQLAAARLESLEARLHPHFLLNTLQAIATLLGRDPRKAKRMLRRLGDLLRTALDGSRDHQVTLDEELRFVRAYLEIERVRLGDRLTVEWRVEDNLMDVLVPSLLIQPLVENAIKHGVSQRPGPGTVVIEAGRRDGHFHLAVEDRSEEGATDMDELDEDDTFRTNGLGLRSVRERLSLLYADEASLDLRFTGVGTRALVSFPCQTRVREELRK